MAVYFDPILSGWQRKVRPTAKLYSQHAVPRTLSTRYRRNEGVIPPISRSNKTEQENDANGISICHAFRSEIQSFCKVKLDAQESVCMPPPPQ